MGEKKRDRSGGKTKSQNALLDELDSLKQLLNEEQTDDPAVEAGSRASDIPMLDDVVDIDAIEPQPAGELPESAIPMLEEVAFPDDTPAVGEEPPPQFQRPDKPALPSEEELAKLIDMLVGHRLRRLRPKIKEDILEELQRLYPELFS